MAELRDLPSSVPENSLRRSSICGRRNCHCAESVKVLNFESYFRRCVVSPLPSLIGARRADGLDLGHFGDWNVPPGFVAGHALIVGCLDHDHRGLRRRGRVRCLSFSAAFSSLKWSRFSVAMRRASSDFASATSSSASLRSASILAASSSSSAIACSARIVYPSGAICAKPPRTKSRVFCVCD